jgi:hypothetical protein
MNDALLISHVEAPCPNLVVRPLADLFFEHDHPDREPFPVAAVASDLVTGAEARAAYLALAARRSETGLTPMLLGEHAWSDGQPWARWGTGSVFAALHRELERWRAGDASELVRALDAAPAKGDAALLALIARLEGAVGGDLATKLPRLDPGELAAFESGDEVELYVDEELPEEPRARYDAEVAAREDFIARARASSPGARVLVSPIRAPDVASALDELTLGASRVVLMACPPHLAPFYLGFGAFNDCPAPRDHAHVWARWGDRYGAVPVGVADGATLLGLVERPPADLGEHARFVTEMAVYDRDALNEGWLHLFASTYRNVAAGFWWD